MPDIEAIAARRHRAFAVLVAVLATWGAIIYANVSGGWVLPVLAWLWVAAAHSQVKTEERKRQRHAKATLLAEQRQLLDELSAMLESEDASTEQRQRLAGARERGWSHVQHLEREVGELDRALQEPNESLSTKAMMREVTKTNEAIKQAIVLVNRYGEVIERNPSFAFLHPLSELPASKEEIKAAIRLLLASPPFQDEIDTLMFGYSYLAHFVPDADAQFTAEVWQQSQSKEIERGLSEKFGRSVEMKEAAHAEWERLRAEVKEYVAQKDTWRNLELGGSALTFPKK